MFAPTRPYIAAACRRAGVPDMWSDDAVQDVLVKLWQSGHEDERMVKLIIDRGAVQGARRYGKRSRAGVSRETVELPRSLSTQDHAEGIVDRLTRLWAFRTAWRQATENQRRQFMRFWRGECVPGDKAYIHTRNLRQRMRILAAA